MVQVLLKLVHFTKAVYKVVSQQKRTLDGNETYSTHWMGG